MLNKLSDFLGGRVLAWLGGLATTLGIVLLLALAFARGWIGHEARVAMAAAGSGLLIAAGAWLHGRRGRTEAAVVMVGAGTVGAFATLLVAGAIYRLIPTELAIAGSMLVGAVSTTLAIRWSGRTLAALGLLGALASPMLVGSWGESSAWSDGTAIALLAVGCACATWVVLWRRWPWLAFGAMTLCAPQWVAWMDRGHSQLLDLAVLSLFALLGLLGAVFAQVRAPEQERLARSAAALALLNALITGLVALTHLGRTVGALWLAGAGLGYALLALRRWPRLAIHPGLRRVLIAIGVSLGDVATGLALHGIWQAGVWAAGAAGSAWLLRRTGEGEQNEPWLEIALGAHLALVMMRAVLAGVSAGETGELTLGSAATVSLLAATCLGCARLTGSAREPWRQTLDLVGLAAVAYVTWVTLGGAALVGAWAFEALALVELGRRLRDSLAWYAGVGFLGAAVLHTVALEAPASALVSGVPNLGAAAIALGAVSCVSVRAALGADGGSLTRRAFLAGAGVSALYLASVAIITALQPGSDAPYVAGMPVSQQGQAVVSALWGLVGVAALVAGLRRRELALRLGALGLLFATAGKVFVFDLSTLDSIYRVGSMFAFGLMSLTGAFAYQRLRPPPPPDLRSLHPTQR